MPSPAKVIAKLKADAAIAARRRIPLDDPIAPLLYRAAQITAEVQRKYPGLLQRVSADRILRKADEIRERRRRQG